MKINGVLVKMNNVLPVLSEYRYKITYVSHVILRLVILYLQLEDTQENRLSRPSPLCNLYIVLSCVLTPIYFDALIISSLVIGFS